MRYDHLDMLPERAFQPHSKYGMTLEGGGGGPSQSTTYTSNLSQALEPAALNLIAGAIPEFFSTDSEGNITGVKPYTPYSTRAQDYVAGFSPQQEAVFREAAGMQRPGQFQDATQLAGLAGMGGLRSAQDANMYGGAGFQSGMMGQNLGIQGGGYYGGMGAGYGARAANIGEMALAAQDYGRDVGEEARQFARQAALTGQNYAAQATDPFSVQRYMSPYMESVIQNQEEAARRNAAIQRTQLQSQATRAGAFGGGREAIQRAEAERALNTQLDTIRAQGLQSAYNQAMQSMQYGTGQGLAGLQAAQSGLGTALQGGQLGLSGIGQAIAGQQAGIQGSQAGLAGVDRQLAGTAQGMQGAQVGLQGVTGAQAGYGLAGQAGTNLANIGTAQQAADLARMGFQSQMGAAQQDREQQIINQAVQNYAMAQENPFQRMSQYSGLIRGYMTPTTTVSQYSAAPSMGSQIGGLAAAAYGASQKKKGGIIKEGGIERLALRRALKGGRA